MKSVAIIALALITVSCLGRMDEGPTSGPAAPIVLDAPVEFTAPQRSTTALPGSDGKVVVTLDDITKGQVLTTLSWQDGSEIVATRSLRENDVVTFAAGNHTYRIKLEKLTNLLIGKDSARFQLWPAASGPTAPIVLDEPVEFTVPQRSTTALPASGGKVVLTLDDITRGQVMTTLSWQNGPEIIATRSFRENDVVTFTAGSHMYEIKLETLTNVLVGEDSATFQLWPVASELDKLLLERKKIETLIASLEQLAGAVFIRNGQEYTLDDAMTHMREKWEWKELEIKTADDFIRVAGSRSSTSGKAYVIRMPDGTEVQTEEWFRIQMESIE